MTMTGREHNDDVEIRDDDERPGAIVSFPFDAAFVERFRVSFPRTRWNDRLRAWRLPGTTAARRAMRWFDRELPNAFCLADERGRDSFSFEPIVSPYLAAAGDLVVRTPYSRTVVEELRAVPWAWWNGADKAWHIPFRSIEELRKSWSAIEAAAKRTANRRRGSNGARGRSRRPDTQKPKRQRASGDAIATPCPQPNCHRRTEC